MTSPSSLVALLAGAQLAALAVVVARLLPGRRRPPAVPPRVEGVAGTTVSVVVPARNEAARIGPCLAGLAAQGAPVHEILVVDGGSTDGTRELVAAAGRADARVRLLDEPARPAGRVGRPWAIAAGCAAAGGDWILVVDADTAPRAGMAAGAVAAARTGGYDAVSFAPRILAPSAGARWLQASFVATLVYRFGAVGADAPPERLVANGQCLLVRRDVLERAGGYDVVTRSFCDDVRIVRHLAASGARVGFLDGRRLFDVLMYPTGAETWRSWPRSLNMRDATSVAWRWLDSALLVLALALPVPMLAAAGLLAALPGSGAPSPLAILALAGVNALLLGLRALVLAATAPSFARRGAPYWLSPLADAAAALRVVETTVRRPREWRGAPRTLRLGHGDAR